LKLGREFEEIISKLPRTLDPLIKEGDLSKRHCEQLLRLEDICERLITTEYHSTSPYILSWTQDLQDNFGWNFYNVSFEELKENIDYFYFDLIFVSMDIEEYLDKEDNFLESSDFTWQRRVARVKAYGLKKENLTKKDIDFFIEYIKNHT